MKKLFTGGLLAAAVLGAALPNAGSAQSFPNARTRNFNNLSAIEILDSCPNPEDQECAGLPDYHYNNGGEFILVDPTPSSLYPSQITVPDAAFVVGAKITDVNVRIKNLSHDTLDDVDIVLVSPSGKYVWLASNISSGLTTVSNLNWKFDDQAKIPLPNTNINTGRVSNNQNNARYNLIYPDWINVWTDPTERVFKPTDYDGADDRDVLPDVPSVSNTPQTVLTYPEGPYNTQDPSKNPLPTVSGGPSLSVFNGESPTGTWKLYVVDDWYWYDGSLGGWGLEITAAP